jgi:outer membrane protein assembly factor BamA
MRGYGYGSFTGDECVVENGTPQQQGINCPVFDRLFGSKVAVANAEFRIPLFGTEGFGLLNFPFLPTEVSPFFDAGISWTNAQGPDLRFTREANDTPTNCSRTAQTQQQAQQQSFYPCTTRIPVFSTGVSFRFNLMGYAIIEAYVAHPFQRPKKNWVWGLQMAPGW